MHILHFLKKLLPYKIAGTDPHQHDQKPTKYIFLYTPRRVAMTPIGEKNHLPFNIPLNTSVCHLPTFLIQVSQEEKAIHIWH